MTSFAIHDLQMYPLTLVDVRDNAVVVARAASWKWMERLSRTACVAVGSIASTCKAPRTGKEVRECAILYSTSKALRIGHAVRAARRAHEDPILAVLALEGGLRLFAARSRTSTGAPPRGSCAARRRSTAWMTSVGTRCGWPSRTSSRSPGSMRGHAPPRPISSA